MPRRGPRLSQMSAATSSPRRQRHNVPDIVASVGGHVIAWADDWEVSGATDLPSHIPLEAANDRVAGFSLPFR